MFSGVEECDDGENGLETDACLSGCIAARCGDGIVQEGVEQCDDGNVINGDACESDCTMCAAARFDGLGSYAVIHQRNQLPGLNHDFTVDLWIKWEPTQAQRFANVLLLGGATKLFQIRIDQVEQRIYFEHDDVSNGPNGLIVPNRWTHIAVTHTDEREVMYIDGVAVSEGDYGPLAFAFQPPLYLGATSSTGGFPYKGLMRQFRIANGILYDGDFSPSWRYGVDGDLFGYWPLEVADGEFTPSEDDPQNLKKLRLEGVVLESVGCRAGFCGDGRLDVGEECDDGNSDETDGCTDACTIRCASVQLRRGSVWATDDSLDSLQALSTESTIEMWFTVQSMPSVETMIMGAPCDEPSVTLASDGRVTLKLGDASCSTNADIVLAGDTFNHLAMSMGGADTFAALYLNGTRVCEIDNAPIGFDIKTDSRVVFGGAVDGCLEANQPLLATQSLQGRLGPVRISNSALYGGDTIVPQTEFTSEASTQFVSNHRVAINHGVINSSNGNGRQSQIINVSRVYDGPACGECGDGLVQAGEACDDGNRSNRDGCVGLCQLASCTDGFVHLGEEDCDDGNAIDDDGCDTQCRRTTVEWKDTLPHLPTGLSGAAVAAFGGDGVVVVGGDTATTCAADANAAVSPAGFKNHQGGWLPLDMTGGPTAVSGAVMVYDPQAEVLLFFGGYNRCTNTYSAQTLLWDGTRWSEPIKPVPNELTPRAGMAATYDPIGGQILMYGGQADSGILAETWSWTLEAGWIRQPGAAQPGPRSGAALAFDPASDSLILFGGAENLDTWRWNAGWTPVLPMTFPPAMAYGRMVTDYSRHEVILYGGHEVADSGVFFEDDWRWRNGNWVREAIVGPTPGPISHQGLVYDPSRQRILLVGGRNSLGPQTRVYLRD